MSDIRERLDEWLRDAHAAEAQAATMLRGTAKRNEDYPEFSRRLEEQAGLCDNHAKAIDQCLADRGSSPSLFKDMTGQVSALGQTLSGLVVGDEVVKAALATATFARMLVSSGRILAAAAGQAGDAETERLCEAMADENERFAADIEGMLASITAQYLARETDGPAEANPGTNQAAAPTMTEADH